MFDEEPIDTEKLVTRLQGGVEQAFVPEEEDVEAAEAELVQEDEIKVAHEETPEPVVPEENLAQVEEDEETFQAAEAPEEAEEESVVQESPFEPEEEPVPEEELVRTQEAAPQLNCNPRMGQRQPQVGLEQRWELLCKRFVSFQPFADDEIESCIQIRPNDLRLLRQNSWGLGNNSFVMHGYYNYRHLLLGKRKDGSFILGIPGFFENQEKFMANMFGFPNFKDAAEQKKPGRFGYWCRPVE